MARKIAFDYDQAVEKAKVLFWQRGYVATGLRDLLKVMDIGESSFYNSLKSKKQLYLACVQRYEDDVVARRLEALVAAPTAAEGIRAFFSVILDDLQSAHMPSPLCMVAAMVTDVVLSDPELRERAEQGLEAVRGIMAERLGEDQASGVLPATLDPQVTASVILTYMQGLWRMALVKFERPGFERQVDTFLQGQGL
ncbi:TetR family transcriptional regulator [Pseudomonas azotoformans]|uniref:TetR family transcriptional regulator n=1 Tax=Pseudomonas azotoformans TaxID=47878 RepID=A0A1V2JTK9_PSEAZ|nr:TetR/AcrR family transcriptional regulator [Pseudomonas azotoformans]OIN52369.1 TetR family transcriptional regulator [Pseudomonas azotoformans]ONH48719.1 TetR family transcriptional regulator [Pseudomonas azotoformans]SDN60129.1 transcriptional regulator, TetR family [Pseudomonas azotoformans]